MKNNKEIASESSGSSLAGLSCAKGGASTSAHLDVHPRWKRHIYIYIYTYIYIYICGVHLGVHPVFRGCLGTILHNNKNGWPYIMIWPNPMNLLIEKHLDKKQLQHRIAKGSVSYVGGLDAGFEYCLPQHWIPRKGFSTVVNFWGLESSV